MEKKVPLGLLERTFAIQNWNYKNVSFVTEMPGSYLTSVLQFLTSNDIKKQTSAFWWRSISPEM